MNRLALFVGVPFAVLLLAAPLVLPTYFVGLLLKGVIYALFAMSFNLMFGVLGLPSLGHVAYFGTAAYVVAIMARNGFDGFSLQLFSGVGAAVLVSLVFGPLSLRARGVYHFMITLALAQLLFSLAFGWRSVTGGDDGLAGIKRPTFGLQFAPADIAFYYFAVGVCALGALTYMVIAYSPLGRVFVGIRENELRMRVLGYNIRCYQVAGIAISAAGAGLAGILFAYETGYVGINYLSVALSADTLLMVILGGAGTVAGPIIGAVIIVGLQAAMSDVTKHWPLMLGALYVVVVLWAPTGIMGLLNNLRQRSAP